MNKKNVNKNLIQNINKKFKEFGELITQYNVCENLKKKFDYKCNKLNKLNIEYKQFFTNKNNINNNKYNNEIENNIKTVRQKNILLKKEKILLNEYNELINKYVLNQKVEINYIENDCECLKNEILEKKYIKDVLDEEILIINKKKEISLLDNEIERLYKDIQKEEHQKSINEVRYKNLKNISNNNKIFNSNNNNKNIFLNNSYKIKKINISKSSKLFENVKTSFRNNEFKFFNNTNKNIFQKKIFNNNKEEYIKIKNNFNLRNNSDKNIFKNKKIFNEIKIFPFLNDNNKNKKINNIDKFKNEINFNLNNRNKFNKRYDNINLLDDSKSKVIYHKFESENKDKEEKKDENNNKNKNINEQNWLEEMFQMEKKEYEKNNIDNEKEIKKNNIVYNNKSNNFEKIEIKELRRRFPFDSLKFKI